MWGRRSSRGSRIAAQCSQLALGLVLAACGGSTGNDRDSGANKTYLSVEASDADGGEMHFQWRVTAGSIENRDARETVWTLPDGPGLHFAYVRVSDGRGGWTEQQYAVSTDALISEVPARPQRVHTPPTVADFDGAITRLRVQLATLPTFAAAGGAAAGERVVYLPDVRVQVTQRSSSAVVFSGLTDLYGEVNLPKLVLDQRYDVACSTTEAGPLASCLTFVAGAEATRLPIRLTPAAPQNLRLYGHVALADGSTCGTQDEFFGLQSGASVTVQGADGTALSKAVRVNRFGDYAVDTAVPARGALKLKVQCEGYTSLIDIPASGDPAGYVATAPIEVSHAIANRRPQIVKMVASGPDGNVRGRMIVPEIGASSNNAPGSDHFLVYKGKDTKLSNCLYYRALGAAKDCDAQGNLVEPISFDDWLRQNKLGPYVAGNSVVSADYINKMDLNLVRRMTATKLADDHMAFSVCNHPGPDGTTQREVDQVLDTAFDGQRMVACVTMEWGTLPGVNGNRPFTKFFTFGPDGSLLPSVNLDGRGEKFLPGACVACHGGSQYNGRFPDKGTPSPNLGSGFLPFDTGNYYFSSRADKTEAAQGQQIYGLNVLVNEVEVARAAQAATPASSAMAGLFAGWYPDSRPPQNKAYVPKAWTDAEATHPGASRLYREVVGSSCRTCHVALASRLNWDANLLTRDAVGSFVCGGTPDVAANASMPNALISRDRVAERIGADPALAALMTDFLGCSAPLPDPVYPKR